MLWNRICRRRLWKSTTVSTAPAEAVDRFATYVWQVLARMGRIACWQALLWSTTSRLPAVLLQRCNIAATHAYVAHFVRDRHSCPHILQANITRRIWIT